MSFLGDINPLKWYADAQVKWFGKDSVDDATSGINGTSAADKAQQAVEDANAQNIALQNSANSTMIELANTAHQREVRDLVKAGINPILSANTGGSSVPNLKAASVDSIAPQIMQGRQMTQDLMSTVVGSSINGFNAFTQAGLNSALTQKAIADANVSVEQSGLTRAQKETVRNEINARKLEAQLRGYEAFTRLKQGRFTPQGETGVSGIVNGLRGAFRDW